MSKVLNTIQHQRRWLLIAAAGIGASYLIYSWLIRKRKVAPTRGANVSTTTSATALIKSITGYEGLMAALSSLEKLLHDLESSRFQSDRDRDRYDLIYSVLSRLRGVVADLQKFEKNDFEERPATEDIARTLWNNASSPKPGTLSVLSDDTFLSANEDILGQLNESISVSVDTEVATLYRMGMKKAENNEVTYRKSRADICGCESEHDFAAKLWCLRQAFDEIAAEKRDRKWLVHTGRMIIADILRQDKKDTREFFVAYDRLIDYVDEAANRPQILRELGLRKVEHVNLWDVLIDFVLLDAFDDLRKPPSGITALVKNGFLSKSMRESTLNNLIWSLIKMKRSRLQDHEGFVSHFYDISQVVSPPLTMGLLGGAGKEFEEVCHDFKDNVLALLVDLFNPAKIRYTTLAELTDDVRKALVARLELVQVKLRNELPPA